VHSGWPIGGRPPEGQHRHLLRTHNFSMPTRGSSAAIWTTVGIGIVKRRHGPSSAALVEHRQAPSAHDRGHDHEPRLVALAMTLRNSGLSPTTGLVAFICVAILPRGPSPQPRCRRVHHPPPRITRYGVTGTAMRVTLFSTWGMNFVSPSLLTRLKAMAPPEPSALCRPRQPLWSPHRRFIPETRGRDSKRSPEADLRHRGTNGHQLKPR